MKNTAQNSTSDNIEMRPKEKKNIQDRTRMKASGTEENVYVNMPKRNTEAKLSESRMKNKAPTTKEESTNNITKTALVILLILFLILVVITGVLLKYYLVLSEDMFHQKTHENVLLKDDLSDLKNKTNDQRVILEDVKLIKKDLENVKQQFLEDITAVKKTLGNICTTCPASWSRSGCSCYYVSKDTLTWNEARDKCYEMKSVLVMVKDKAELDTVNTLSITNNRYWIGMRRDINNITIWKWLDGTQITFTYWREDEPNNKGGEENCGEFYYGPWNDRYCENKAFYICKR